MGVDLGFVAVEAGSPSWLLPKFGSPHRQNASKMDEALEIVPY